jgi:exonuclease SbcC
MSLRLKSLLVEDFRSIRGTQRLSLDAPAVLIHGPNGTGKTSLLSAIEFGLTGAIGSLGRFDPAYREHLPHKKSPTGKCRVAVEVDGLSPASTEVIGDGQSVHGSGLLSGDLARFFIERCYLPQAALGRLLEIYEHQDSRRTDSPLTRFVKELLGLEALDALIDGLHSSGDVRRLRERASMFWAARAGAPNFAKRVRAAADSVASLRKQIAESERQLRAELEDLAALDEPLDPEALVSLIQADIDQIESRLLDLARRRRDLAAASDQLSAALAADARGQREAAETASRTAREALATWQSSTGTALRSLFTAIRARIPSLPDSSADPAPTHAAAVRAVEAELQRIVALEDRDAADEQALSEVQESLRQGTSRLATIDAELEQDKGVNQELAQALTAVSAHIDDETCPVCGRDFSEVSDTPLAAHVSEEVQRLISAAGRVQALVRDRSTSSAALTQAQRRQSELTARRLSPEQRDQNKTDLAQFTEWKTALTGLAEGASTGSRLQTEASAAAGQLSVFKGRQAGISGLRAELMQHAATLGLPAPADDVPLRSVLSDIIAVVDRDENTQQEARSRNVRAREGLAELAQFREEFAKAEGLFKETETQQTLTTTRRDQANLVIASARDLANRAQALRTEKVRQVFNDELNAVWRELFIRLAPDEEFVPAFALPAAGGSAVEAVLETHYRSGGKGGNPRAMLSAGNLNTAALTLFLALNLSVKPVLPWLIIDDPVQSMDDVHIAQFAALLRTLKQEGRQVILAVHDRQLFDYLALELSPTFNGDRLITIELGRSADGMTTAPWRPIVFEPDRAIAA